MCMLALVVAVVMPSPGVAQARSAAHAYDDLAGRSATTTAADQPKGADQAVLEADVDFAGQMQDYDERARVAYTSAGAEHHVARDSPSGKVVGAHDPLGDSADPASEPGWVRRDIPSTESGLVTPRSTGGGGPDFVAGPPGSRSAGTGEPESYGRLL